jgi:diguanylate cyclase (GGDEF)-like protein
MKKTTGAPKRARGAKGRRKAAGTRNATASRKAAKAGKKVRAGAITTAGKTVNKGRSAVGEKTTAKAGGRPAAIARSEHTIRQLKAELAQVRRRLAELQASAETDFLLGIFNRRGYERELSRAIAYFKRYRTKGALIILDLDRLKPINDTFGHAAGDEVLKAVAATLAKMVRASDVVGRLGGDEFAVLLWNLTETDARAKAQALEQAIDGLSFSFDGRAVTAGASAGLAILGPQTDTRRVLEEADGAMYIRKAQRRHEAKA